MFAEARCIKDWWQSAPQNGSTASKRASREISEAKNRKPLFDMTSAAEMMLVDVLQLIPRTCGIFEPAIVLSHVAKIEGPSALGDTQSF